MSPRASHRSNTRGSTDRSQVHTAWRAVRIDQRRRKDSDRTQSQHTAYAPAHSCRSSPLIPCRHQRTCSGRWSSWRDTIDRWCWRDREPCRSCCHHSARRRCRRRYTWSTLHRTAHCSRPACRCLRWQRNSLTRTRFRSGRASPACRARPRLQHRRAAAHPRLRHRLSRSLQSPDYRPPPKPHQSRPGRQCRHRPFRQASHLDLPTTSRRRLPRPFPRRR